MTDKEREYYTAHIQARLTEWRFRHSVNVSKEAVRLAEKYGCDVHKAELAGLLHDVMKDVSKKEQLEFIEKYDIKLSKYEENAPKLWHAITGAVYVRKVLDIKDKDICNAIRYHTTGRAGMSLLEKIIYVADCTSEERDYEGVDDVRSAADSSLDDAVEIAAAFTLQERLNDHTPLHPDTVGAYNDVMLAKQERLQKSEKKAANPAKKK